MKRFTDSIRESIKQRNWYAALFLALCLPDICSSIATPNEKEVKMRYKKWFNDNLAKKYSPHFSADDCYYFRCGCLHQGLDNHAKLSFERIHFIPPHPDHIRIHRNKINGIIQMQVDVFCNDIADSVDVWFNSVAIKDLTMQERMRELIVIHDLESISGFISFG